jgi:hypothetical protein
MQNDLADIYYLRALSFCKQFAQAGELENSWDDLRVFIRWPGELSELRDAFCECGIVDRQRRCLLYRWEESNGWIVRKYAQDAKRQMDKRKAGRASARARRVRARAGAVNPGLGGRLVGRGKRASTDGPRTIRGRRS